MTGPPTWGMGEGNAGVCMGQAWKSVILAAGGMSIPVHQLIMTMAPLTVVWPAALVMLAGAVAGGVFGARVARRLPPKLFRWLVIGVGSLLTVWYFVRP